MNIKQRPLFWVAIFFAIGIVIGNNYNNGILSFFIFFISGSSVLFYGLSNDRYVIIYFLIFLVLGFAWINWQESKYHSQDSIAVWNDKGEYLVTGEVVEDLTSLAGNKIYLKPYLVNSQPVKYGLIQLDKRYLPFSFENGEIVKIKLFLKTPASKKNPGGFSYRKYLKRKGILSQGYLEGNITRLGEKKYFFKNNIIKLKRRLIQIINYSLQSPDSEVIKALILGERDHMPEKWDTQFTRAGANHLLAISGLHVGFILLLLLGLTRLCGLSMGLRNFFITFFISFYIILTGARASVFRAGILSVLFLWAPCFKRKGDLFNILGITALLNLIINPYSLFTIGFQLTYTVLLSIVIWTEVFDRFMPALVAVSLAAQIGSIPITAFYFNYVAPVGILTNIWAIPMTGVIVFTSFISLMAGMVNPILSLGAARLIQLLLELMKAGISFMANIPGGYIEVTSPAPFFLFLIYILIFILPFVLRKKYVPINMRKRRFRLYFISFTLLLVIIVNLLIPVFNNQLEVIFFSVGQGDGILLALPGDRHILVDGGGRAGPDSSQGEAVILPYLKKKGIRKIDIIFVTHFDTDHVLGIADVLQKRDVKLLILPEGYEKNRLAKKIIALAKTKNVAVKTTGAGDRLQFGKVFFQILHPGNSNNLFFDRGRNTNSIVLRVSYVNFSLLLTGDLEQRGERKLMRSDFILDSDIIKLGHHGSNSSSGRNFLQKVSPQEAIISVGRNNYGHPSVSVLKRVNVLGINTWNTDRQGAIIIDTDGNTYHIKGYLNKKKAGNQPD